MKSHGCKIYRMSKDPQKRVIYRTRLEYDIFEPLRLWLREKCPQTTVTNIHGGVTIECKDKVLHELGIELPTKAIENFIASS